MKQNTWLVLKKDLYSIDAHGLLKVDSHGYVNDKAVAEYGALG